jgi:hypothetical protein
VAVQQRLDQLKHMKTGQMAISREKQVTTRSAVICSLCARSRRSEGISINGYRRVNAQSDVIIAACADIPAHRVIEQLRCVHQNRDVAVAEGEENGLVIRFMP